MNKPRGRFSGNNTNWGAYADSQCKSGNWNDCASSAWNDGQSDLVIVYQNISYGGGSFCFPLHTYEENFADTGIAFNNGATLNDAVSSNTWFPSATGC
ncbi:MAG TPA: peptidase inhibitor family I36 protein [Pseudonocardiaceae bacterium]|nr:peptidase inhibitor family I36 protein [Pseudonocardiaceae bacterium]